MSRRDSLSRFVLPFVGAAVLTAGTLLLQIGRKPTGSPPGGSSERPSGRAVPEKGSDPNQVAAARGEDDESLLRRLRERGL